MFRKKISESERRVILLNFATKYLTVGTTQKFDYISENFNIDDLLLSCSNIIMRSYLSKDKKNYPLFHLKRPYKCLISQEFGEKLFICAYFTGNALMAWLKLSKFLEENNMNLKNQLIGQAIIPEFCDRINLDSELFGVEKIGFYDFPTY